MLGLDEQFLQIPSPDQIIYPGFVLIEPQVIPAGVLRFDLAVDCLYFIPYLDVITEEFKSKYYPDDFSAEHLGAFEIEYLIRLADQHHGLLHLNYSRIAIDFTSWFEGWEELPVATHESALVVSLFSNAEEKFLDYIFPVITFEDKPNMLETCTFPHLEFEIPTRLPWEPLSAEWLTELQLPSDPSFLRFQFELSALISLSMDTFSVHEVFSLVFQR
jgi:hypothetical protein